MKYLAHFQLYIMMFEVHLAFLYPGSPSKAYSMEHFPFCFHNFWNHGLEINVSFPEGASSRFGWFEVVQITVTVVSFIPRILKTQPPCINNIKDEQWGASWVIELMEYVDGFISKRVENSFYHSECSFLRHWMSMLGRNSLGLDGLQYHNQSPAILILIS